MTAIVICTQNAKCLPVLATSITFYVPFEVEVYLSGSGMILPRHRTINSENTAGNFGDAYNVTVNEAFKRHSDVILCNDDVVLTPYTWQTLMEDVSAFHEGLGYMACRSDYARGMQNVRYRHEGDSFAMKHASEDCVVRVPVIAPIFAYIQKQAWVDFPPINWYSDDIQCHDINQKGYQNYISRSYVHHVGSQTCGMDYEKCVEDAKPWILENRPEFAKWFKTDS
jgi:hypothetical protein